MKVCVVGSGGREHSLAMALARSPSVEAVAVCPGNPGIARLSEAAREPGAGSGPRRPGAAGRAGTSEPVGVPSPITCVDADPGALEADLWVIGPEAPLVAGLADRLRSGGRLVLGPGADGARLEGSKAWMKELLESAGVPSAAYAIFSGPDDLGAAVAHLRSLPPPWVVKTDGLASGKGVLVTHDLAAAVADLEAKLSGTAFGGAGRRVVIEEGLAGVELTVMAVCDGTRAVPLAPARDHKRAGDGDTGPNTGGMGAYSPVAGVDDDVVSEVMAACITPTVDALRDRGVDYRGVLYAGLMLTERGPKVIEFNVRFGDPETQVVLPRFDGDLALLLAAAARGDLGSADLVRSAEGAALHVVLAAAGYPEAPRTGDLLDFDRLVAAAALEGVEVVAAGIGSGGGGSTGVGSGGGGLVTAGGRVLGVTGRGPTLGIARERAYAGAEALAWPGCHYRSDIGSSA